MRFNSSKRRFTKIKIIDNDEFNDFYSSYINKPKLDLSSLPSSKISSNEMNYKTRIKGHKIDEDPGLDSGQ